MRSTILVRSTIHTRVVLLSIDQYMDMHQHFHNTRILVTKRRELKKVIRELQLYSKMAMENRWN